jgi:hypothetical protein
MHEKTTITSKITIKNGKIWAVDHGHTPPTCKNVEGRWQRARYARLDDPVLTTEERMRQFGDLLDHYYGISPLHRFYTLSIPGTDSDQWVVSNFL